MTQTPEVAVKKSLFKITSVANSSTCGCTVFLVEMLLWN